MRDAFPIVCKLGERLTKEATGWRDVKALILLVAREGDWNGAAALGDALGVPPGAQEAIFNEAAEHKQSAGGASPAPPRRSTL